MNDRDARVCALVVTRNRRDMLTDCLESLANQTRPVDRVVVVDSASTDGTDEVVQTRGRELFGDRLEYVRLAENRGSAGGYGEALRRGAATDADWLWTVDDDAEPRPDALAKLLAAPAARSSRTAALATAVVTPDGEIDPLHRGYVRRFMHAIPAAEYRPGDHRRLGFASYTGLFARADVVRRTAPPREEFFTWCDDVEYTLRLGDSGEIRLVPESVVVHRGGMGGGRLTRRARLWNRVLGTSYTAVPQDQYWKVLYGIRNFVATRRSRTNLPPTAFLGITAAYILKSLMYDDHPTTSIPQIVRAAAAGWRGGFRP